MFERRKRERGRKRRESERRRRRRGVRDRSRGERERGEERRRERGGDVNHINGVTISAFIFFHDSKSYHLLTFLEVPPLQRARYHTHIL